MIVTNCRAPQIGSERNKKAAARLAELSSTSATWQSKFAEGMGTWNVMFALWGLFGPLDPEHAERSIYPNPSWDHIAEAFDVSLKGCTLLMEAQAMADDSDIPFMAATFGNCNTLAFMLVVSHLEKWQPEKFGVSEAEIVAAMDLYDFHKHTSALKAVCTMDFGLGGCYTLLLGLHYGNLGACKKYCDMTCGVMLELGIAKEHDFGEYGASVVTCIVEHVSPLFIMLDMPEEAHRLYQSVGFAWDGAGTEACWKTLEPNWGPPDRQMGTCTKEYWYTFIHLIIVLAWPDGALEPEETLKWMPSPAELRELEKSWCAHSGWTLMSISNFGARAYERLGRDEEAAETARFGVEMQKRKVCVADCHCVLGRVSARRGDLAAAEEHFLTALELARESRCYAYEIVVAREWNRFVLTAADRAAEADGVIDAACARMGKERTVFSSLLEAA